MAINKNHEFGEVNEVKCSIVEKDASKERVSFLKDLLEHNRFTVIVAASPPPKVAPVQKQVATTETTTEPQSQPQPQPQPEPLPSPPETFTVGVTNVSFNPTNAIFGRQLKTKSGLVVTLAYWEQKEEISSEDVPYFENLK